MFEGLFENLRFQRLLAQEPMKFANVVLQSPIIRSRHDLFPAAGRRQAALRHQLTPGEQLVWGNAMPTSHQAYRHTRLEGLFDHANLLRGLPAARGLPRSWNEIAAGHLLIAQESLEYGWWEAIVLERKGDTFTLQYRDYPHLPKFVRHRSSVALMCPLTNDAKPAAAHEQA